MTRAIKDFRFTGKVLFVAFALFVISIVATAIHEHAWKSDFIFYGYIKHTMRHTLLAAISMVMLRMISSRLKKIFDFSTIILSLIIFFLVSFSFNRLFPVTIDRSFSIYMIGVLYKFDSPLPLSELNLIVSKYFHERTMINKRIQEQLAMGNIAINNGQIELTKRGKSMVEMNILMGRIFNLDMNNIAPDDN